MSDKRVGRFAHPFPPNCVADGERKTVPDTIHPDTISSPWVTSVSDIDESRSCALRQPTNLCNLSAKALEEHRTAKLQERCSAWRRGENLTGGPRGQLRSGL
jgi:hypothetical protein